MPTISIKPFAILLVAQGLSIFGTSLTGFAMGVWVYREVGSVTIFFMIALAHGIPLVLLSPLAGAVVDRVNRKRIILLAQLAALSMTVLLMYLFLNQLLRPWHIIALVALNSIFQSFVWPAVTATVPLMVPKSQLTRANGMISMVFGVIHLTSPAISGTLYDKVGINIIFIIDLFTYACAFAAVLLMHIPQPCQIQTSKLQSESMLKSISDGWHYLNENSSLKYLILFYSAVASILMAMGVMVQPMILSFTTPQKMGFILSVAGSGVFVGSIVMMALRSMNRHMPIIIAAAFCAGIFCLLTPISKTPWVLAIGGFFIMACFPVFDANNRALLQRKVEPSMLGRVLGLRNFSLGITRFFMMLITGLIVDYFFEPAMLDTGFLSPILGDIYGVGKGRGIALLISILGGSTLVFASIALYMRSIRKIDTIIDDFKDEDLNRQTENNADFATPASL